MIRKLIRRSIVIGQTHRRTIGSGLVLGLVATSVVIAATTADGVKATNIRLDDGSVWVTDTVTNYVGRLNLRIDELDTKLAMAADGDVLQQYRQVVYSGPDGGTAQLNPMTGLVGARGPDADVANYQLRGQLGLYFDAVTGLLWVGNGGNLAGASAPTQADARLDVGSRVLLTWGAGNPSGRGKVLVFDPTGWWELQVGADGKPVRPEPEPEPAADSTTAADPAGATTTTEPEGISDASSDEPDPLPEHRSTPMPRALSADTTMTAVGDRPVFLDPDGSVYSTSGDVASVPGDDPVLQQAGPEASTVLVASSAGLFEVKIGGSAVTQLSDHSGLPAQPVRVAGCVYGAWAAQPSTYVRSCGGSIDEGQVDKAIAGLPLIWRVNGVNVALNQPGSRGVWAVHEGKLAWAGNWDDVDADANADPTEAQSENQRRSEKDCVEGGDVAPTAGDDTLGVRPRPSIVDVLYNDDDANCEPIAVASITPSSGDWGTLSIIDNGQHLLFSPSQSLQELVQADPQSLSFDYTVADTSGNESASAEIILVVADEAQRNSPPSLRNRTDGSSRQMAMVVEEGHEAAANVLSEWFDPDGDDLTVTGAFAQDRGEVTFSPDGVVRYAARGVSAGLQTVYVEVSDGIAAPAREEMEVTVKPAGSPLAPVPSLDFLTVAENGSGVVAPLTNDSDPNGDALDLVPEWDANPAGYRTQVRNGIVEVTGLVAGVYDLPYSASDGLDRSPSHIRLVVTPPGEGVSQPPLAVPDRVVVRADRVINVDVLANDVDPDGDILAVVAADEYRGDGGVVRTSIVDRRFVQIEVAPGTSGVVQPGTYLVTYQIDDGNRSTRAEAQTEAQNAAELGLATGTIAITVKELSDDQPPQAAPDSATVRRGDIVAVPVLRNDTDPDNDTITLESVNEQDETRIEAEGSGVAWVSGRFLYFFGSAVGQEVVHYNIVANGRPASGEVRINVTAPVSENGPNNAPSPGDIVLRAVRGSEVRVPLQLWGVDADGDRVEVLPTVSGLTGAEFGNSVRVDESDSNVLWFKAGSRSPSADSFQYSVRDGDGNVGTANVRVMIVDDGGWAPVAHDDVMSAKPGRTVTLSVLANDSSPVDRPLELDELPFFDSAGQPSDHAIDAGVELLDQSSPEGIGRITVVVPETGTVAEQYRVSDGRNTGSASIRVSADPTAANVPPVAIIDKVLANEVVGKEAVTVAVAANDYDPDDSGAFTVSLPGHQNATVESGGVITVPLTRNPQVVLYRLTDAEGASTIGVVEVAGLENHAPELSAEGRDPSQRVIEAASTEALLIRLSDVVADPDNDPDIRLTDTVVVVTPGQGTVERLADDSGFRYTPPAQSQSDVLPIIRFEVTDRPDYSKAERQQPGCNCLSTLEVAVTVRSSSPPRILSQGSVQVPQLDDPATFDLKSLVIDDQGDPLTFTLTDLHPGGLDVSLDQQTGIVTLVSHLDGAATLPVGVQFSTGFTVADATFGPQPGGVLSISIIETNRPKPAPAAFPVQNAERDFDLDLPNVVSPASNPFAAEGRPLTVTSAAVSGGAASVTCSETGDCVFYSDTIGTFEVSYVLRDAAQRTVTGSITVVVKGKPREPGVPGVESVGDHLVNLTWTSADPQGSPITRYAVTAVESGAVQYFTGTGGAFTGLKNGQIYHFTVAAENALGLGPASSQSSQAVPDRVPDPPVSLEIVDYADGSLTLQWAAPPTADDYTTIIQYEISIAGQSIRVPGGTTTTVVTGLTNGTDYAFTMRSQNSATVDHGWGAWSAPSLPDHPSRYPDPPQSVQAVNSGDGAAPKLTVTWQPPPFDGGRPIASYEVCRTSDNSCQTITTGLQATFDSVGGTSYTFRVRAFNSDKNKNDSNWATSLAVTAVKDPAVPIISSITSGDTTLTVNASTTNGSGCSSVFLEYSRDGGTTWQTSNVFTGLSNGTPYTNIVARAHLASTCGTSGNDYKSGQSTPASGTPYGALPAPTITAEVSGTSVRWKYSASAGTSGRGPISWSLSGNCSGSGSGNVTNQYTGWTDFGYSASVSCTITVNGTGQSKNASAPANTPAPPVTVNAGCTSGTSAGGTYSPCWFTGSGSGFAPNQRYYIQCWNQTGYFVDTQAGYPQSFAPRTADGAGNINWGIGICYDGILADVGNRYVRVWDDFGHSVFSGHF